ncbi:MAG: SH3 domain-containing protein [Lachnospiraceae bacterium]|nr:SH3 domain-containing protein [Lachnospiraceae bacterium]
MQKKKAIVAGISVVVVIAAIMGGIVLHKNSETVETMAEATEPITEETSPVSTKKTEETTEAPQTAEIEKAKETAENVANTEHETDVLQENEREQEKTEQDAAKISEDDDITEIDAYMYTTADLNMRKKGTTESEVIGSIPYGTEIHVTARTADNWYRTERGEIGYVSGKYLSDTKPEQNTSSQQASYGSSESTQPSGASSSVPSISQADMNAVNAAIAQFGELTPYTGPTSEMAWESAGGGHHLNQ